MEISNANIQKLGEYLRSEREKRRITIEQIASATKINIKLLHALESDNYDVLPAKPFVRGFVANYARYIGLDPRLIVDNYEAYLDEHAGKKFKRPDNAPHIFVEKDTSNDRSRLMLAVIMGGFLVVGVVIMIVVKPSLKRRHHVKLKATDMANSQVYTVPLPPQEGMTSGAAVAVVTPPQPAAVNRLIPPVVAPKVVPSPTPSASVAAAQPVTTIPTPFIAAPKPALEPVVLSPDKVVLPKAKPTPAPKVTPTAKATPVETSTDKVKPAAIPEKEVRHKLVIRAKEDAWVKYQSDDRPLMAYTLRKDKVIYVRGRDNIRFSTGNPKALEYSYNNGPYQSFKGKDHTLVLPVSETEQYKDKMFTE